jgi:hypothetical protein
MVSKAVLQWEPAVRAELAARGIPLPVELILAVIRVESGGKAGTVNPHGHASGLMQILPITLKDFNQRHGTAYPLEDLQGQSDDSIRKQIQVGVDVLARYWKKAYKYLSNRAGGGNVPIDDLARIADLFYRAGPGATRKKLDKLSNPTWIDIQAAFPDWAPLKHPKRVFKDAIPWNLDKIGVWLEGQLGEVKKIAKDPKTGFAAGILLLMVAYWLMSKDKKR